jgi:hypothetical protein
VKSPRPNRLARPNASRFDKYRYAVALETPRSCMTSEIPRRPPFCPNRHKVLRTLSVAVCEFIDFSRKLRQKRHKTSLKGIKHDTGKPKKTWSPLEIP